MTVRFEQLASWVQGFRTKRPSEDAIQQAKLVLLDALGCALAARPEEIIRQVLKVVTDVGGEKQARILGTEKRSSVTNAVFANGVLIRVLDLNDFFGGAKIAGHPSDNIAVALTVGDWGRSSGLDVLSTIVMAYELYSRLQDQIDRNSPWDHVTATGLVAPAIAGFLMNLDADRMSHGMALSAAHCPTLGVVRWGQLSAAKGMANAAVAQGAIFQTLLAAQGLTGPLEAIDGPRGLAATVFTRAEGPDLVAPVGDQYRIMNVQIKANACVGTAQSLVSAALELRPRIEKSLDDIETIEVTLADLPSITSQLADHERRHPSSRETADHSFYFLTAVTLLDGKLTADQFEDRRWEDRRVKALMDGMTIRPDQGLSERAPKGLPARIRLLMRNGQEHVVEVLYPPGHPNNRLDMRGIVAKFARYMGPTFHQTDWDALVRAVETLDQSPTLDGVLQIVCRAP
jgi:2-methylcitrate dehydratase